MDFTGTSITIGIYRNRKVKCEMNYFENFLVCFDTRRCDTKKGYAIGSPNHNLFKGAVFICINCFDGGNVNQP